MAYSTPLTAVANNALTAAQWNASVRDNILETPAAKFTAAGRIFVSTGANAGAERVITNHTVDANQTTTSTSYTNLTTTGPTVTVTTGARALSLVSVGTSNSSSGNGVHNFASVAVSSATTDAAADIRGAHMESGVADIGIRANSCHLFTALNSGSNIFTIQYRTASGTASFDARQLTVIGL